MIGRTLGHYRIEARLGEGGMGVVYRAHDTRLNRPVALKVLPPDLVGNEERRLRFQREAQAAAALNHPNICTIHAVEQHDGVDFLVMELLEGETLRERIGHKPMPLKTLLPVAIQVGEALQAAHERGVLHRDLKPDNVFITKPGTAKVLDFGLAKILEPEGVGGGGGSGGAGPVGGGGTAPAEVHSRLETISRELTMQGKVFGTVAYMSPEQARGERVTHHSDLFSFGVVLYEMATGRQPFKGKTDAETLASILKEEALPLHEATGEPQPELERIIGKALEKDPQDRYHHADDMVTDLRRLKRATDSDVRAVRTPGGPVSVATDRAAGRHGLLARAGGWRWVIAAALIAAVVAGGVAVWRWARPEAGFKTGDRIVVADFDNTTGNPLFDTAVRDAFENMLSESILLRVVYGQELKDLVKDRLGEAASRLDAAAAERLCGGGACAGYLLGSIAPQESGFSLKAALHRAGRPHALIERAASVAEESDLLRSIHEMVMEIRKRSGETPQAVSMTDPPTTRSVVAYQHYAVAAAGGRTEERAAVLREALATDPDFVQAYMRLSDRLWELGDYKGYREAAVQAYRRSSGLPQWTRMWSEIYFLESQYQYEQEIDRLKAFRRLYPFDATAAEWLGLLFNRLDGEDDAAAEVQYRDAFHIRPTATSANFVDALWFLGKEDAIRQLADDCRSKGVPAQEVSALLMRLLTLRGDVNGYHEALSRHAREFNLTEAEAIGHRMGAMAQAGMLADLEEAWPIAWRQAQTTRNTGWSYGLGLLRPWLRMKRHGEVLTLPPETIDLASQNLQFLPDLAYVAVLLNLPDPLERALREHERTEGASTSRYVQEELQYARALLALMRGDRVHARNLMEPIAIGSDLTRRHWALGRVYEALGMWREAAGEFERYLASPRVRWGNAGAILDRHRLARIYERLGDTERARHWYESFTTTWKDADPDIPELIEARQRLQALGGAAPQPAAPKSGAAQ